MVFQRHDLITLEDVVQTEKHAGIQAADFVDGAAQPMAIGITQHTINTFHTVLPKGTEPYQVTFINTGAGIDCD
ncbi:hypothetical protein D3C80_2039940 [compost metagenome]